MPGKDFFDRAPSAANRPPASVSRNQSAPQTPLWQPDKM